MAPVYDVAIVSDMRMYGGSTRSSVQESVALHAAGYRTALVPVPIRRSNAFKPVQGEVRAAAAAGLADLVPPDRPIHASLTLVRAPATLRDQPAAPPRIATDQVLIVANSMPAGYTQTASAYDVREVTERAQELFDAPVAWAPISPMVRDLLRRSDPQVPLWPTDWVNVIDADAWRMERRRCGRPPVVGRHSRDVWLKWPPTAELIRQAYPAGPDIRVTTMGGAQTPRRLLGGLPEGWTDLAQDHLPVRRFLASIDVFVHYHHPDWYEAFGRSILEALATGAPAILDEDFEDLFGDAAVYVPPAEVADTVLRYADDPGAYHLASVRALAAVADRFSFATHVRRVASLVGAPRTKVTPAAVATPAGSAPLADGVVLLVSVDGTAGSWSRLAGLATRLGAADDLVVRLGPPTETPALAEPAVPVHLDEVVVSPRSVPDADLWRCGLAERVRVIGADLLLRVVLIDGSGAETVRDDLLRAEVAGTAPRCPVLAFPPRDLGQPAPLPRAAAREAIGLDARTSAVLVPGAPDGELDLRRGPRGLGRTAQEVTGRLVRAELGRAARSRTVHLGRGLTAPTCRHDGPFAAVGPQHLGAVDLAVVEAHAWTPELAAAGVPTIVLPADDDGAIRDLAAAGVVVRLADRRPITLARAVRRLLTAAGRAPLVAAAAEYARSTDPSFVAVEDDARTAHDVARAVPVFSDHARLPADAVRLGTVRSGAYLRPEDQPKVPALGVVAVGLDDAALERLVARLAEGQAALLDHRPIVLTDRPLPPSADERRFASERIVARDAWHRLPARRTYDDYLRRTVARFEAQYGVRRLLVASNDGHLPDGLLMAV